jgi:hypothetical protein
LATKYTNYSSVKMLLFLPLPYSFFKEQFSSRKLKTESSKVKPLSFQL